MPESISPVVPEKPASVSLAERVRALRAADADAEVPSPCIGVCRMDEARGWCAGCLRTRDELRAWRELDNAGRRVIWSRIEERLAASPAHMP